ncbi:MAG: 4-(cytidine 5'-diphospho)-2-C-methyl-D-erythritol kinase [Erythrobacter sp.]|nr:4-(cytidine 5'-diphospho)-2-C-methyl-D-erythritol kinase [Erythrobacter sp.]
MTLTEIAYAKINLALHVRSRREDGYHDLETLFAFVDAGDTLSARIADEDRLTTVGEFADGIENPFDNLVAKALGALSRPQGLDITLEKNLPVAAGMGGGSADAGAAFRIVERLHGLPDDWPERAAKLGADVPSCVRSEMAIGYGTGTELKPIENDLEGAPVLLLNPRITLSTAAVFKAWDMRDRGPLPAGTAREIAEDGRNDLLAPAIAQCAQIAEVLDELRHDSAWKVEMSGSGATCFALYSTTSARDDAARRIASERPEWWQMSGNLR